jgi:hypothetical protein
MGEGLEQSHADFTPTEADWENLKHEAEEIFKRKQGLESRFNYEITNGGYQDFNSDLTRVYYRIQSANFQRTPEKFKYLKRLLQSERDYLDWMFENNEFRTQEFYRVEIDKKGRTQIGYFPQLQRPELIIEELDDPAVRQEARDRYGRELQELYDGDKFIRYVELSKKEFERNKQK